MVPLGDEERKALLEEVVAYTQPPTLESDEFTRSDYVEESGLGMSATKNRLEHLVDRGILEKRMVFDPRTRRQVWAYRKVGEIPSGHGDESSTTNTRSVNNRLADLEDEDA